MYNGIKENILIIEIFLCRVNNMGPMIMMMNGSRTGYSDTTQLYTGIINNVGLQTLVGQFFTKNAQTYTQFSEEY